MIIPGYTKSLIKSSRRSGVTLIELIVSISIFGVVMSVVILSFLNVIRFNRQVTQKQNVQDHIEFLVRKMNKEIKTAQIKYDNSCDLFFRGFTQNGVIGENQLYLVENNTLADTLKLINSDGECVFYRVVENEQDGTTTNRLQVTRYNTATDIQRQAFVLPQSVGVVEFRAKSQDFIDQASISRHDPPYVEYWLKLRSKIWEPQEVDLYNFISARNIEQF